MDCEAISLGDYLPAARCGIEEVSLQVRSIIGQVRPDRQTLLYSATMPNKVEKLVRDALTSPVRITVGELGAANEDIKQVRVARNLHQGWAIPLL